MIKLSKKILLAILMICMTNLAYMQPNNNKGKNLLYAKMELQKRPVYFPLSSKSFKRISSGYGMRKHPILKKNKFHYGLDLAARKGTPIYASAHGKVVKAEFSPSYGNYVVIDHDYGYKTLYGHMMVSKVKINQKVKQGAIIGFVGSTGRSTGPHLHYEILKKNKRIDPFSYWMNFLKKMEVKRF